jgi:filamentous hemagglutinin
LGLQQEEDAWGSMEANWKRALDDGKTVEVEITPIYTDASGKPTSFRVTEIIDGVENNIKIKNL